MKRLFWNVRYAIKAMWVMRCSPSFAWTMADNADDYFDEGESPSDALYDELSYWTD